MHRDSGSSKREHIFQPVHPQASSQTESGKVDGLGRSMTAWCVCRFYSMCAQAFDRDMGTDCEGTEVEGLVKASGHENNMNPWLVIMS